MEVVFYPQGTLAEKIRAGGVGLGGILVDVGVGTIMEQGKDSGFHWGDNVFGGTGFNS